jgi:heme o synthase
MPDETRTITVALPSAEASSRPVAWRDLWEMTKPEISLLVTLSSVAGFVLGSPGVIAWWTLLFLLVGTALTAAGVGMLNHYYERDLDAEMKRTAARPLPAGRVSPDLARKAGFGLVAVGIGIICPLVNPLTAALAILTVVLYVYVYTPMKRTTTYNTLMGTIPGALPALGGWTAATGTLVGIGGWSMFLVLAFWQMPHFLAIAWMYRKDYARARYAMLPVVEPDGRSTAFQTLAFTAGLLVVSLLPAFFGVAGLIYGIGALLLGAWFLVPAAAFFRSRSVPDARRVLMASIAYVPLLVALICIDRLF